MPLKKKQCSCSECASMTFIMKTQAYKMLTHITKDRKKIFKNETYNFHTFSCLLLFKKKGIHAQNVLWWLIMKTRKTSLTHTQKINPLIWDLQTLYLAFLKREAFVGLMSSPCCTCTKGYSEILWAVRIWQWMIFYFNTIRIPLHSVNSNPPNFQLQKPWIFTFW